MAGCTTRPALICVNNRAGGHAGTLSPEALLTEEATLGKPLICAGGIGIPEEFADTIKAGYVAAQLGTRCLASTECSASRDYKRSCEHMKTILS